MLHATYEGKRWGFVDATGEVVVPPTYLEVRGDARELIAVKDAATKKWGFVDASGAVVIAPGYDSVNDFTDGIAFVMKVKKKLPAWSVIDARGATVIADAPGPGLFSGEFALVRRGDGTMAWMDRAGAFPLDALAIDPLSGFADGLAVARDRASKLCGFVDTTGSWAVAPTFESLAGLREGLALACDGRRIRFVDATGAVVIDTRFETTSSDSGFSEGRALYHDPATQLLGYLDRKGEIAIAATFGSASAFRGGFASAGPSSVSQGAIDPSGAWVVEPRFYEVRAFQHGIARAFPSGKKPDTFGLIDATGAWVWRPSGMR